MPHQITISAKACRTAYERFGKAFIDQFITTVESMENNESGPVPPALRETLQKTLDTMLKKVGKVEKKPKTPKKNAPPKTVVGIRKRFKYKGKDQKGKNESFLRINIDRTTREVSRVNESNWTQKSLKRYNKVFGRGKAWMIPQGNGKKAAIIKGTVSKKA